MKSEATFSAKSRGVNHSAEMSGNPYKKSENSYVKF